MLLKLKYLFSKVEQKAIQLIHYLQYGGRISYNGLLGVDGKYKVALDASNSKIIFEKDMSVRNNCSFLSFENGLLKFSSGIFINNGCSFNCLKSIEIGENTIFGEGVKLYDHNHRYGDASLNIKEQGFNIAPIKIGNNCWIGSDVIILKGVTIGDNSIIGAGCLIYNDIPPNSIVKNNSPVTIQNK